MDAQKSLWREYLEALLIAVIFATFARTYLVQAFKIPSGSMEENLLIGDHILVNKFVYGPVSGPLERALLPQREIRHGDVVVFKFPKEPERDFIKRCVGLPGDTVEISDKVLYRNGQPVAEESYVFHFDDRVIPSSGLVSEDFRSRDQFGPMVVPAGHYFCLGDNRDNSNDSRVWGPVPESHVKGRALLVYWSRAGEVDLEPADSTGRLRQLARSARRIFQETRWERTFKVVR
ncbi:MAG TPA: signal peptidase I [Thermoanaerobaculia bacterium]|nr:signal peptidase I [Thermoanaerobaculia bacterium]